MLNLSGEVLILNHQKAAEDFNIELKCSDAKNKKTKSMLLEHSFLKVDVIAFAPVVETGWDTVLKNKAAIIPVIVVDRMVKVEDDDLYVAWMGSNFEQEGRDAAEWLIGYLDKIDKVMALLISLNFKVL